ncbi:hypothetical protein AB0E96_06710, partial [Kitasatospora sp. NPDC036755]|uniref:hypothetical protein n=1 Tax=Kitasatospora sp. NPDC036755 TaxID=3154600 RepID=UPI0033EB1B46
RDIRFVRLWFTDVLGFLKSVAVAPAELEQAFARSGRPAARPIRVRTPALAARVRVRAVRPGTRTAADRSGVTAGLDAARRSDA